jgi:hypothetical protein
MHTIVIVGAARQPALSFGAQIVPPECGIGQLSGVPLLDPFSIGTQVDRLK